MVHDNFLTAMINFALHMTGPTNGMSLMDILNMLNRIIALHIPGIEVLNDSAFNEAAISAIGK